MAEPQSCKRTSGSKIWRILVARMLLTDELICRLVGVNPASSACEAESQAAPVASQAVCFYSRTSVRQSLPKWVKMTSKPIVP